MPKARDYFFVRVFTDNHLLSMCMIFLVYYLAPLEDFLAFHLCTFPLKM